MPKMFEVKVYTDSRSSIGTFICLETIGYANSEEVKVVISTYRYYIILFDVPDLIPCAMRKFFTESLHVFRHNFL